MGIGVRIFLVNEDDSLTRLPIAKYERLLRHDSQDRLEQYAGRRVRYALVVLGLADRKPWEIIKIEYSFLLFDSQGRIDTREEKKEAKLAMEMLPPLSPEPDSDHLVDARHRFARKQYDDTYRWKPGREMERAILEAVFGKDRR